MAKAILEAFPNLSVRDVQSRAMGSQGTDVVLSQQAFTKFPFAVECKNQESNKKLIGMWQQAFDNTGNEGYTLLVLGANHSETLAVISFDVFMDLVRKVYEHN